MEIEWINGQHKEDNLIFNSVFEAEEWADSVAQDLSIYLWNGEIGGYKTLDIKVFEYLKYRVPFIAEYNNAENFTFNEGEEVIEGQTYYKFWITHK